MDFETAFTRLMKNEGGFTNDPSDPGNWTGGHPGVGQLKGTKFGIAANTYPDLDIEHLTLDQARAIYRRDWWDKINADVLPPALVYQLWKFAVNAGMGTAKRKLQAAVGVAEDGRIGPVTVAAVKAMDLPDVLTRFHARVLRHYASLTTWRTFGKGWVLRVADDMDYAAQDT